jgi:hypothetical protein
MKRFLFVAVAGLVGAAAAAVVFLLTSNAAFFAPQAYANANEWYGLSILSDLILVLVSFLVVFALAAWVSVTPRAFWFMAGGIGCASLLMAGFAYAYHPAPQSLHTNDQIYAVGTWVALSVVFAFVGRGPATRV